MAVPVDPTATTTVTWAMRCAGQYAVSDTQIAQMIAGGFQEVKAELWLASKHDILTATETMMVVSTGTSLVTLPSDFDHEIDLRLFWGNTDTKGYAAAGAVGSITLASDASSSDDAYTGLFIFLLSGTGSTSYRQISGYVGSTRVASVSANWTAPTATTQYQIGQRQYYLIRQDAIETYRPYTPYILPYKWLPSRYEMVDLRTMRVWPAPDQSYALLMKYIPNLTRLDETGTLFVRHLRERYDLWVQGIKVKTLGRFDDDRFMQEKAIWEKMKSQYAAAETQTARVPFSR